MSPPAFDDLLRVDSNVRTIVREMIQDEVQKVLPQLRLYATVAYVDNKLSNYVEKRDLYSYLKREDFNRELDTKVRIIVDERFYVYTGTQMGMQALLKRQTEELNQAAEQLRVEYEKKLRDDTQRIICEALSSKDGSVLVEQIAATVKPSAASIIFASAVVGSIIYGTFFR
jgi:hypothetical protein